MYGRTALHMACRENNGAAVESLLAQTKENLDRKDAHGFTPLCKSIKCVCVCLFGEVDGDGGDGRGAADSSKESVGYYCVYES